MIRIRTGGETKDVAIGAEKAISASKKVLL